MKDPSHVAGHELTPQRHAAETAGEVSVGQSGRIRQQNNKTSVKPKLNPRGGAKEERVVKEEAPAKKAKAGPREEARGSKEKEPAKEAPRF